MKKNNIKSIVLMLAIVSTSGVIFASNGAAIATMKTDMSSVNMKFITKTVSDFNNMLSGLDPNASNLGDVIKPQLDILVKYIQYYIDNKAPKSTKPALKAALKELNKVAAKYITSLNNSSDVAKNKKQITDFKKSVLSLSTALSVAQMLGAR